MKNLREKLEKLRVEAANCAMISALTTDRNKRELFAKLADHHKVLAAEVEPAIKQQTES
jgi:hypothetical protein